MSKTIPTTTSLLLFDKILEAGQIKEGHTVADLGCGRSLFFLWSLAQLVGKEGIVYGVDILPEVVESLQRDIAHHKLHTVKALQADLEEKNGRILDTSLSAAFLLNTLHQTSDSLAAMEQASRLLEKNGILVVVDWLPIRSPFGPHHSQRLDPDQIKTIGEMVNLQLCNEFTAGPYHYGLAFSK